MTTLILAFDTETTGLPSSRLALNDPAQPHLVSLSALQIDTSSWRIMQSTSKLVVSAGWEWEMDHPAAAVHCLTPEACAAGRSEKEVLDELLHLWFGQQEALLTAHNLKFDRDIISIAIARYYPGEAQLLSAWQQAAGVCTMLTNKERVDARTVKGAKKLPNLKETYQHFMGEALERHHSANADAVAVYLIYRAMQAGGG